MCLRQFQLISICVVIILFTCASAQVYNVNMDCGTCQNLSGCMGNICLKVSGDINDQYCYGKSTCDFSTVRDMNMSRCLLDSSGQQCKSEVCMNSLNSKMCLNFTCVSDGGLAIRTIVSCSDNVLTTTFHGGVYERMYGSQGLTITSTVSMGCPFTSGYNQISQCTGDDFGDSCSCCVTSSFQGMTIPTGNCVPQNSPIVQVKNSMIGVQKYGFKIFFTFGLIFLQLLFIAF